MPRSNEGSNRGIFLNLLIVLSVIGLIWRFLLTIGRSLITVTYSNPLPIWYNSLEIFSSWAALLLMITGVIGIFKSKKWGIYLLALGLGFDLVFNIITTIFVDSYNGLAKAVGSVVIGGLWFLAISKKKSNFS